MLRSRWKGAVRERRSVTVEALRYLAVGTVALVVDVGGFNLLRYAGGEGPMHDRPLAAKVISATLATGVSWVANRHWTFRHRRRAAARGEFLLFSTVAGASLTIAVACLALSHHLLGLTSPVADNVSANGVGLVLSSAFRFWAYRAFVFNEPSPTEARPERTPEFTL